MPSGQRDQPVGPRRPRGDPPGDAQRGDPAPGAARPGPRPPRPPARRARRRGRRRASSDEVAGEERLAGERDRGAAAPGSAKNSAKPTAVPATAGDRRLDGGDHRDLPGRRADQPHRGEPLLAAGGGEPGRGADEDEHREEQRRRDHGEDEVDAVGVGAACGSCGQSPADRRGDRGDLDGIGRAATAPSAVRPTTTSSESGEGRAASPIVPTSRPGIAVGRARRPGSARSSSASAGEA